MSNLIINTAYFTQKVFVTNINLATKPFLNITNMSVTGDISINNVTITGALTPAALNINATKLDFNYNVVNNSTKIASSIGYSASVTPATMYTLVTITSKKTPITIIGLNAGAYIFDYSYSINPNSNNVTLYQLYEYIDNSANNITTNLLTKNNTFTFTSAFTGTGNQYNTTYGILTGTTNTVTFSLYCIITSAFPTVGFSNFYLRYTRIG